MRSQIFKYLSQCSTQPNYVDRLIISAFLTINKIIIERNKFLKTFIITEADKEEFKILAQFVLLLEKEIPELNFEALIELFEFVISPADRIINGAVYTPAEIRKYIVAQAFHRETNELKNAKIADIACGCSGFLYTAAKELKRKTGNNYQYIFQNQIFGLDIQNYSITRSKLLLSLLALFEGEDIEEFHFNLHQGDALIFKWEHYYENFEGFQIIIGNPPYVCAKNLENRIKENLQNWSVCTSGNPDLYIPFFQIGYENLVKNGILGFITMNTFFKSLNGRALRKYFEDNRATIRIIDFGVLQIFKSKSTYTCICFIQKSQQNYIEYYKSSKKEFPKNRNLYSKINFSSLDAKKGWNLNKNDIISKIESVGKSFGELYKTSHGIATLRNDIYIFRPAYEDKDFYYLQNGSLYPIEKGICKDIFNSNKLSRKVNLKEVKEKVLFPYDSNTNTRPQALEEKILEEMFPMAYEYLKKKKKELEKRDKGKGKYEKWFAFGRTQCLERVTNKLFFPKYSDKVPDYLINSDADLLFYNGQAIIGHSTEEMSLIKKIMESRVFWFYIKTTSKPYSSNYYSLNGTYVKNFGIPKFNETEIDFIINEDNPQVLNEYLEDVYGVTLSDE